MNILDILLLGCSLSMDAFSVSVCKGLALDKIKLKHFLIVGLWFGGFQALMPAAGYLLGTAFLSYIESVDHWIGFLLLLFIGGNMIKESLSHEEQHADSSLSFKTMLVMAVATSIDALAVGVTLPSFGVKNMMDMALTVLIIGVITFVLSTVGVKIGNIFGTAYQSKAEFAGGTILILLGLKLLLEGLGIITV